MIIDFHTHDFPDGIAAKSIALLQQRSGTTPYTDGTFQGLMHSMEQDLLVVFHAGVDIGLPEPVYTDPERTLNLLRDTGDGNIILAHLGGWKCKEIIERFHIVRKDRKSRFHLGFTEKAAFKVKIKKLIQI